jgi:cytochrome c oxidase subunit 4
MSSHEAEQHLVPYSLYVKVWAALLVLTGVTVGVSYLDLKHVAIFTAMLIACCKSMLVLLYFMHIRFERLTYVFMILAALITYAIFISLTFLDYSYR